MPPNTISVARPSRWGNPFVVGDSECLSYGGATRGNAGTYGGRVLYHGRSLPFGLNNEQAVWLFRDELVWILDQVDESEYDGIRAALGRLTGKNLGCWCPLDERWCHADVLLDLSNNMKEEWLCAS